MLALALPNAATAPAWEGSLPYAAPRHTKCAMWQHGLCMVQRHAAACARADPPCQAAEAGVQQVQQDDVLGILGAHAAGREHCKAGLHEEHEVTAEEGVACAATGQANGGTSNAQAAAAGGGQAAAAIRWQCTMRAPNPPAFTSEAPGVVPSVCEASWASRLATVALSWATWLCSASILDLLACSQMQKSAPSLCKDGRAKTRPSAVCCARGVPNSKRPIPCAQMLADQSAGPRPAHA